MDLTERMTAERLALLDFGARAAAEPAGFGWLDDDGSLVAEQPLHLWVNARMTHVFSLAHLLGVPGSAELVDRGLAALTGPLRDDEHGGWWSAVERDGRPVTTAKEAYPHAFVLLAASSAVQAGRPGADDLLREAADVVRGRFWDDDAGACVETWDAAWSAPDGYRGANANMHAVEAFLAAADATGDDAWWHRASRIADRLINRQARAHAWRIPEHYDAAWVPDLDYARDHPSDPFRPFGATIGHALEWARLLLHLDAARPAGASAAAWAPEAAAGLFAGAVRDGWSVDGAEGLVYTVDWDGAPVVRQRMHWVVAEGIGAAAALHRATGEAGYRAWVERWWDHAERAFVEAPGRWWHELGPDGRPASTVWSGRPDVYHAVQATLVPQLPLAPSMAAALAAGEVPASS